MAYRTWQVGLDIQNGQLCAVAAQRCRRGWQLRHWWRQSLPELKVHNGVLSLTEPLVTALRDWRRQLPRHVSLRVGFPPHSVQQHLLTSPALRLCAADRNNYVMASARRLFPIELNALALDYRAASHTQPLCLTATRRETLDSWLTVLHAAGIVPEVMELSPNALRALAYALGLPTDAALVFHSSDHWLWYCPSNGAPVGGWHDATDFAALREQTFPHARHVWFSAAQPMTQPEGTQPLLPFQALAVRHPPLPREEGPFSLAVGLALRPEDS